MRVCRCAGVQECGCAGVLDWFRVPTLRLCADWSAKIEDPFADTWAALRASESSNAAVASEGLAAVASLKMLVP